HGPSPLLRSAHAPRAGRQPFGTCRRGPALGLGRRRVRQGCGPRGGCSHAGRGSRRSQRGRGQAGGGGGAPPRAPPRRARSRALRTSRTIATRGFPIALAAGCRRLLQRDLMDGTRSMGESIARKAADARAARVDGGAIVGGGLREQGVRHLFALNGGHPWPILARLRENGVQMIHMRHEQSCAYAADGYARTCGRPGVLSVTAGCGLTNAVTGLCVAGLTGSAVVCLAGQHPTSEDQLGSFQEAYGSEICRTFSNFTKRVLDWPPIGLDVGMAFREAMSPPPGPTLVEIPTNILYHQDEVARQRRGARVYAPGELRSAGDPAAIDRALEALARAERPLVVAGDGIFWSDAAAELRTFARAMQVPVYTRRASQGALPEDDALAVRGAWKKPFTGRADVIIAIGFKFWSGEHFGSPPTWNAEATYIQIDPVPSRIGWHVEAEIPVV